MVNVLVGLIGLGLVVFVHELGHLVAAKATGITVEAFSVGWGRKIWSFTRGETEYRVSWLPLGGYCKMQGEHALLRAWQDRSATINVEKGDFYAARPWQRILVLLSGPGVNFIFAVIVLAAISMIGYSTFSFPNRIVVADDFFPDPEAPARIAGLQSGDYVTEIDGREIASFRDLQMTVSQSAQRELTLTYRRDGVEESTRIVPALDQSTGAGRIGVFPWVSPVVAAVAPGSPGEIAGLQPGDRIRAVGELPVEHTVALEQAIRGSRRTTVTLQVERDGSVRETALVPGENEEGHLYLGIAYETMEIRSPDFGPLSGLAEGFRQSVRTLVLTVRGIGLLFAGVDLNQALMGPARITYLVGEVAAEGFRSGIGIGLLSFFNFLSLISITLFFMNLLPIPALDGGQIVLTFVEIISRRPLHPRLVYRYQVIGNVIILGLLFFAVFNDILFFARR
ncbi:MAG: RIP metalloprotease RseP [Spirochaetaceae bacterium]|nr:MAG: RIP metalloprotease RseP [Spirochaetaceae bacterium]